ncbi:MAG: hypothetical protein FWG37_07430, partial [Clostridia bacterium]|nr:hypothetical protein [Clostridia bacterium]
MSSLFRPIELVNVQTLPLDKVETISISYIAESVTVLETDGDALILKEYYSEDDPDLFARITNEDGALIIRRGQLRRLFNAVRGYVEVFLPRQFFGVLNLKSVSGKIESGMRLVLSELNVSNTS